MIVKLPCDLGKENMTPKGVRTLVGVSWFKWSNGIEFTYSYIDNYKCRSGIFYCEKEPHYQLQYKINDELLLDDFLKIKDYPLKGKGFLYGFKLINKKLFAELILTDYYYAHVYVECDKKGNYIKNGSIYVPPSWDTQQKKYSIVLHQYKNIEIKCINR